VAGRPLPFFFSKPIVAARYYVIFGHLIFVGLSILCAGLLTAAPASFADETVALNQALAAASFATHPSHRRGQEELALHRPRRLRPTRRHPLHHRPSLPPAGHQSLRLPLKDVLTQIPHHTNKTVAQLTQENWLKNRQSHASRAA
jgi:hypothetical protein